MNNPISNINLFFKKLTSKDGYEDVVVENVESVNVVGFIEQYEFTFLCINKKIILGE